MIQSMYSGVSGLKAFKSQLDVIGNNIANLGTIGFKTSRVTFRDTMSQTMSAGSSAGDGVGGINPSQVGLGVTLGSIDTDTTQGALQPTGKMTDVAVDGDGYFVLGNGMDRIYSRDGSFTLDADYNLVSASSGMKVLGWMPDPSTGLIDASNVPGAGDGIRVPVGTHANARQTSIVRFGRNLDADAPEGTSVTPNIYVYDSLGISHRLNLTFTKTANPTEWSYDIYCPDVDASDPPVAVSSGLLTFDVNGNCNIDLVDIALTFAEPNGSMSPLSTQLSFGSITQLSGATTVAATYNDGLQIGTLQGFDIDRDGTVVGRYDNGSRQALGKIALAVFSNPAGLLKSGSNTLTEGPNSGIAQIAPPGVGGRGSLAVGFLESSNVDLSTEFANMIIAQRGFQANSRIVTVSDEVIQELVQLKR